ncbi:MAG: class I SAM-dependent methyltransferase [Anaerolineaceae bacterium]|nr:class I SAM-dependent methyltransferase [Anaerolineaceae bacterium]
MKNMNEKKSEIRQFWSDNPMTYGESHGMATYTLDNGSIVQVEVGSCDFFMYADKVFYNWNVPRHKGKDYFGKIFNYEKFKNGKVLEIGCGMGCMAMNWAQHGANVTAIDLNPIAVEMTKKRFQVFGLEGKIQEADAESLPFDDNYFDYVYSWGVLHHSPGIEESISEIYRVLRPGGEIGIMLYHRNSILYRFIVEYIEGFLNMEKQFLNQLELSSRYGDGAREEGNPHTWPMTRSEIRLLLNKFDEVTTQVFGTDIKDILNQWLPSFGNNLPEKMLNALAKRIGWSVWSEAKKTIVSSTDKFSVS